MRSKDFYFNDPDFKESTIEKVIEAVKYRIDRVVYFFSLKRRIKDEVKKEFNRQRNRDIKWN